MRVLVCGSHHASDHVACWKVLDALDPRPGLVIAGGAEGIDTFAETWALLNGIPCMTFKAAWICPRLGSKAGPIRNAWMLTWGKPDLVLAFPGESGTENMVLKADLAGVTVRRVG